MVLQNLAAVGRNRNAIATVVVSLYLMVNSVNIFLDGSLTWTAYSLSVLVMVFLPAALKRDWAALPPFEILLYLAIPFTVKGVELGFIAAHTLDYLSAAGIALLVVTELQAYTSFSAPPRFMVWFVSLTTIATAGFWAAGRWLAHIHLGTPFNVEEHALMWEFVAASMAGLVAGGVSTTYFRRKTRRLRKDEG